MSRSNKKITPKKPILTRFYDKLAPGNYTHKQDVIHGGFVLLVIIVVFAAILSVAWTSYGKQKENESTELTIPSVSFVSGQESNVENMLIGYGFKNIHVDDNGDIKADGNYQMVKQYKESYQARSVSSADELCKARYDDKGIENIKLSDDARTLTITTYTNVAVNSQTLSNSINNDDINKIISTYATWCGIRNNGEKMKTVFKYAMDIKDVAEAGQKYYESTKASGTQMVAELEAYEQEQSKSSNASSNSLEANNDTQNGNSSDSANSSNTDN